MLIIGNCKVAVYLTDNLWDPGWDRGVKGKKSYPILFWTTDRKSSGAIQVIATEENDILSEINKGFNLKKPKASRKPNTFNYIVYNGRNYYYSLSPNHKGKVSVFIVTEINADYLYWVDLRLENTNLTKEDLESILYFEVL